MLLADEERRRFLRDLRRPNVDALQRAKICQKINEQCRKVKVCPHCKAINGAIRKTGPLKLVHDKFVHFNKSTAAKKVPPLSKIEFDLSFAEAKANNPDLEKHLRRALDDLNPQKVLRLFKNISDENCELLGLRPGEGRPEMFLWRRLPVPPVCLRPSVQQEGGSNEDDITAKLSEIVFVSSLIRQKLQKGEALHAVMHQWEYLGLQVAMYVNSEVPGLQQPGYGKPFRGFCQRLKGKQGRFRGNLSGKRVDFSGRTVISPDPNLAINEVAVPLPVAKNLTYPEKAQRYNLEKLRQCIRNGPDVWPGAQSVIKTEGTETYKIALRWGDREQAAQRLRVGDVVERHLEDNDIVLFNRQPSLHKLSIMSHFVKVRPWRTFRLNECVCTPYNADFDGDEMNLHVPQTEEARAEALTLMGVKNNLITPKNGEPIIAATQDFITAAYLLSSKDRFFDRKTFTQICMHMLDGKTRLDLPHPAVVKPRALWTGKQVFSILMRPNKASPVKVNLDAECRDFKNKDKNQCPDMDANDRYLVVRNSEVMCGLMDKSTVGPGMKSSIFYVILRDYGPDAAVDAMNRLAKLCARQLTNRGFSIGPGDVYPTASLTETKTRLVETAYKECDKLITKFNQGKMEKSAGCTEEQTLENSISGILSRVRDSAGKHCIETLSKNNTPLLMAKSGGKGSSINVAQMVAVVGQQIIGGQRVTDGFQERPLPHFVKKNRQPPAKGFVRNSFYTGLRPPEFFFHAMSGREGLVDTAVKTAETGYMSRRLMKSLEDLATQYDDTVRTSSGGIVQFQFGSDKLDPVDMEGAAVPVNFDRTWTHAENLTWNNSEPSLLPDEVMEVCERWLKCEREHYPRIGLLGDPLEYDDGSVEAVDDHEGARLFLKDIEKYVSKRAEKLSQIIAKVEGMGAGIGTAASGRSRRAGKPRAQQTMQQTTADQAAKISRTTLDLFIKLCLEKYKKAQVEPGHAVGAVGAQSIGEPGTQMTLKTFHFAGVAGMSITQGVPRINEIINASKDISTPVITCKLENDQEIEAARAVKGRMVKTHASDVLDFTYECYAKGELYLILQLRLEALERLQLGLTAKDVATAIYKHRKLKVAMEDVSLGSASTVLVRLSGDNRDAIRKQAKARTATGAAAAAAADDPFARASLIYSMLPDVRISGYPDANRAIIKTENGRHEILVEGHGLRACMTTEGVVGTKTTTNDIMECRDVLGIEAARVTIAKEIGTVMGEMNIDPRHMQLLADVMTYKGDVHGITRFGMSKTRDSVLQLASFEKTADHLFEAAASMKVDRIEGVSESIIMGQSVSIGTGSVQVVRKLALKEEDLQPRPTLFEDAWKVEQRSKTSRKRRRK